MKEAADLIHDHNVSLATRTVYLGGEVGDDMVEELFKNLNLLQQRASQAPITIMLNSGGGCVQSALAIYDMIQSCESHVTITVLGEAASSASIILQAADLRRATKRSTVMYHSGTDSIADIATNEFRAAFEHSWVLEKFAHDIMYGRMKVANPKLKPSQFSRMVTSGLYLAATEAVRRGLLDEILT